MTDTAGTTPLWTVTDQRQMIVQNAAGQGVGGWRVTFRTRDGAVGYVDVPQSDYTPNKVAQMITDQAHTIVAVHGLEGPPS